MYYCSLRLATCACHGLLQRSNNNNNKRGCLLLKAASYYTTAAGAHWPCRPTPAQCKSITGLFSMEAAMTRHKSITGPFSTEAAMTRHSSSYTKTRPLFRDGEVTFHHHTRLDPSRIYCSAQATPVASHCWNCTQPLEGGEETPAFFCLSCKVVQPPSEDTSYFTIMACDQTFTLDTQQLQKRFIQLQRSLHPDNFSQKTLKEQEYSEKQSALVNKAYRTLQKPLSRGLYMLELEGMHIEEGTDQGADAHFLLELMEINEAVDEAQSAEDASSIGHSTKVKLNDLTKQIDTALRQGQLHVAKELLVRMKYFTNIEDKVKEKLSELM